VKTLLEKEIAAEIACLIKEINFEESGDEKEERAVHW
jgi:hypothetical protein